jgi:hypothetical protein
MGSGTNRKHNISKGSRSARRNGVKAAVSNKNPQGREGRNKSRLQWFADKKLRRENASK